MSVALPPAQLASLRAVYGDRVPADASDALRMLDASPLAPADAAQLQALRARLVDLAGKDLPRLEAAQHGLIRHTDQDAKTHTPLGGAMALRLAELTRAKTGGLERTLTAARAVELFNTLARAPDIPHNFVDEGCHFRAHVESARLEQAGVYSEKAFCVPDGSDLRINSNKTPLGFTLGMFHTAPCVFVRSDDGQVHRRIIDPSLFDQPVSVEQWQSAMHGLNNKPCNMVYLPRFALHLSDRDNPPDAWRPEDVKDAQDWNTQYKEVQQGMEEMGFYDHLKELVANAGQGHGG